MSVAVKTFREPVPPQPPPSRMHRFTVDQYHRMIQAGVLTENDRVELLEGWIVDKMPQHPPHSTTIAVLRRHLSEKLPEQWVLRLQSPVSLPGSEPEPDLAVARGPDERYFSAHPGPDEIAVVIEVSDHTLDYDRAVKARIYARARIPIYWIVNLRGAQVEVYSQPRAGKVAAYRQRQLIGGKDALSVVIAGKDFGQIPVRRLFPA